MSRFEPTVDSLTRSLEWHARVTTDLQQRVTEAQKYIRGRINDPQLARILNGAAPEEEHDGFEHCPGCQAAFQAIACLICGSQDGLHVCEGVSSV